MAEQQLQLSFVRFVKDSYVIVEGKQNTDRFFIIHEGKVELSREVEVVAREGGNILGPGDFFGVVSTMASHSHIETALALTDVILISVLKKQYGQLIQNNAPVAMKIIREFSRRVRYLDEALTRRTLKSSAEVDAFHLFRVGEHYTRQNQYNQAFYAFTKYIKNCPQGENVSAAKENMKKIAPYVKMIKLDNRSDELVRVYPKDYMLFAEGEPGEELYIIQQGSVKISKIVDNKEVLLAVLKTGDIFGEMALLESKPRAASAIAYEDCQVLTVNRANFEHMITTQPQMIARLTTLLSERIWSIYRQLGNTLFTDPVARMYDALLIQLEKKHIELDSRNPFIFDFGPKELINMIGLAQAEQTPALNKFLENKKIGVVSDKIRTLEIFEITKQVEFFRKMQKISAAKNQKTNFHN
ncbi:MAG: cyclic nucleotide-binding domain-containing protein [Treponema sp.]|jgi:CRP-like cAMP-binding protein|nr:cyclic nucleotide-binding domain-containing protein [Treponema sp.]